MIIFGTRGRRSQIGQGEFQCPRCHDTRPYKRMKMRRWFTLYFIPVFPTEAGTEFVECDGCRTTFRPEVLHARLAPARQSLEDELRRALARVLASVYVRCSTGTQEQFDAAGKIFRGVTMNSLPDGPFKKEIADLQAGALDLDKYLASVGTQLSAVQREQLVDGAIAMGRACGVTDLAGDDAIRAIAAALQVTPVHLQGLVARTPERASA